MPVPATLEQLFDVNQDPTAKERFLSGRFNMIQCQNCGYKGQVGGPLLYHDPAKELLLSFVPMDLGLPQAEQEKLLGRLMNEVINKLPQEKRKGYLLNPKQAFTLQGMLERVLEADGVTKEMLDSQRAKVQVLQSLINAAEDKWPEMIKEHDAEIDMALFQLLSASGNQAASSGNQAAVQKMSALQRQLLDHSSFGKQIKERQAKMEGVARELQALGNKLTADKLLELVMNARDDDKLTAYVSLARPGMDYSFFEALTRRVDKATGEEKERLGKVRDKLLQLTQDVDKANQAQMAEATNLLRTLIEAPDVDEVVRQNVNRIDDAFLAVLQANLEAAQKAKRADMVVQLNRINESISRLMQEAAPPELQFIDELLQLPSDAEAEAALKQHGPEITQELVDTMTYVGESLRQSGQTDLAERLDKLREAAVGELMRANWQR
jgi:ABC-type transporter Mla MlaB component